MHQFGSIGYDWPFGVASDSGGNVYIAGSSFGDAFVRKYDAAGNLAWTQQFGSSKDDSARGIAVDATGAIVVVGWTQGGITGVRDPSPYSDAFVRKYDPQGSELWTREFWAGWGAAAHKVSVDSSGNIYVAGNVQGIFEGQRNYGSADAFVRKYDGDGNELWTRQLGSYEADFVFGVAADDSAVHVLVRVPIYTGVWDYDVLVRTYDAAGNELWTDQFVPGVIVMPGAIAVDGWGNVYVTGDTQGTFQGEVSSGGADAFVRKYGPGGSVLWTRQFGSLGSDSATSVAVDGSGNVHVAGSTTDALPGQTAAGSTDAFLRIYSPDGEALWTRQFGTTEYDAASFISVTGGETVYDVLVGGTRGAFPGQTAEGNYDAWVAKMGQNAPPAVDAGGPYSVDEGHTLVLTASGSDPDGDSLTYGWDLDGDGTFETAGQSATFSATQGDGPSSHVVAVQVSDGNGFSATAQATVEIQNVAPTVGTVSGPSVPVAANSSVAVDASFVDPGILDTHTALWQWGDGSTTAGDIQETNGTGSVRGTHVYNSAGIYTVELSVSDDDGGSSNGLYQYVVVYDPSGGYATGAGSIDSPAGAFAPDPSLQGRAVFGFVSRYQAGASQPTGQTQFQFALAGLRFVSTSYDWLVVSGARAQFKGLGSVNGAARYGFLLTAVDGQANGGGSTDTFRIKIWDRETGVVLYDNQMGASDSADPTTALTGGSILVRAR